MLRSLLIVSLFGVAMACGAKTGLRVPEFQSNLDGGMDARPDVVDARDARDATDASDVMVPCIELPDDGGVVLTTLRTAPRLARADTVFLIDVTLSMSDEIEEIRRKIRDVLAPAITAQIPDTTFAVATFADFPVEPYGTFGDEPFALVLALTNDLSRVQAAMNLVMLQSGSDEPESQVEGLRQLMTGAGLPPYIQPSFGCPSGGDGYACFRPAALPIILLFTDARFHNGPGGSNRYSTTALGLAPSDYSDTLRSLRERSARVVGFFSGTRSDARIELETLSRDTGAIAASGAPLVFDIGVTGSGLGTQVVEAMRQFVIGVLLDVGARAVDPQPGDGVDVTRFVRAIDPLRAEPMSGIGGIDVAARRFLSVRTGTMLTFQISLANDTIPRGPTARRFALDIAFDGDGASLGSERVNIVIPGTDGSGCGP